MMSNLLLLFLIALVSCEKLQHTSRSCVADTDKDSFGVKVFETKVDPQPRVTKKAIACFVCRKFVF